MAVPLGRQTDKPAGKQKADGHLLLHIKRIQTNQRMSLHLFLYFQNYFYSYNTLQNELLMQE